MSMPSIEVGDRLVVDVSANLVWVQTKEQQANDPRPKKVVRPPDQGYGTTVYIFQNVKPEDISDVALSVAFVIAWARGFGVKNVTEDYVRTDRIFVYEMLAD